MFFIPFLFICSLSLPTGDRNIGPNCMKYRDIAETGYSTLTACHDRLDAMFEEVKMEERILFDQLPGPYRIKGYCTIPYGDEVAT